MGYHRAGFEVIGVDISPHPNYPFSFVHGDALEYLKEHGHKFDVIHASPPCQHYSKARSLSAARNGGKYGEHPDLVGPVREMLKRIGKPYIIENVAGAPLENPISLYGSQFGLKTQRHRRFECSFPVETASLPPFKKMQTPSAGNGCGPDGSISICGSGGVRGLTSKTILTTWSDALGGVDWMTRQEMAECVPPAYTEFIGRQAISIMNL